MHRVKGSNSSISNYSNYHKSFVFAVYLSNSSIWPISRSRSGANTPSQSGPENDGNGGVLHIPQSCSITIGSPSDFCVKSGHSIGGRMS